MRQTPGTAATGLDRPVTTGPQDFAELSRRVREAGLMTRRRGYYVIKIAATVGALGALAATAIVVGNSWWNLLVAVGLAFVLAQLGFIGHDAGHRQVSGHRARNDLIGLVLTNLLTGVSFGWWLTKHSRHHAHTNQPGSDPDLTPGALVYTREEMCARRGLGRWLGQIQVAYLVPLLFLEAHNLHLSSVMAVGRRRDKAALAEGGLLLAHVLLFFVAPFLILSPVRALVFVFVSQSLFGFYLGASFLTNHVGMPTPERTAGLGFLHQQVLTSRNLRGPLFTTFLFGGLDTQIEHHLFPTMPRANLRRARTLVRAFCDERVIAYAEESPWRAYRNVFHHLLVTGAR